MSKNKKDKKESSMFDMIEDMTGIPSEYIWVILAILFILIIVGVLYMLKMGPFDTSLDIMNTTTLPDIGETVPTADLELEPLDPNPPEVMKGGIQIFKKR